MRRPNFERLSRVLNLDGEPDYIPFYELFADPEIMGAVIGKPFQKVELKHLRETEISNIKAGKVKFYSRLGYDYVPLNIPSLLSRNNIMFSNDLAQLPRAQRVWQNENKGVIEVREDFDKYPWPDPSEVQDLFLPLYDFAKKKLPENMMIVGNVPGGVLESVMWLMGAVPFLRSLYKDPILIRDMFDKIGPLLVFCSNLASELGMVGALAMGDDMGYKNGLMMSPKNFRKYVLPWQKKCVDATHKLGKPFILHTCGNLKTIMDDLIDYVGIDAKHSYEDSTYPITEYKRIYGQKIAVLGGIDMDKLARMPNNEFQRHVRKTIDICAPGGGYALGCGNSVANYVKLENYLTMLEIGKKYGKYPLRG